ncbi:MAG: hypothetical protein ACREJP_01775 [Candidatus Methylomirabilales bacterium]
MTFVDADSSSKGLAIVRAAGPAIGLTLSLENNGDIEVFLRAQEVYQLIDALKRAVGLIADENGLEMA